MPRQIFTKLYGKDFGYICNFLTTNNFPITEYTNTQEITKHPKKIYEQNYEFNLKDYVAFDLDQICMLVIFFEIDRDNNLLCKLSEDEITTLTKYFDNLFCIKKPGHGKQSQNGYNYIQNNDAAPNESSMSMHRETKVGDQRTIILQPSRCELNDWICCDVDDDNICKTNQASDCCKKATAGLWKKINELEAEIALLRQDNLQDYDSYAKYDRIDRYLI